MITAIDFTKPLPGTIFKADTETWQTGKRIRAEIQRLYNRYHVEARCADQDRKYGEKRNATHPGRGDAYIANADRREQEAYDAYRELYVAYHKWSGSAQGEAFDAPITPEETALLEAAAR